MNEYDVYEIVDRRSERNERRERYMKNKNRSFENDAQRNRKWNKPKRRNKVDSIY